MSENWVQLQAEEIEALNSIFDEKQWKQDENDTELTYTLTMNHRPERAISLDLTFIDGYPTEQPLIYNIRGPWLRGQERQELTNILENIYLNNIGKPVAFLWADALRDFVDKPSDINETVHMNTTEPIVDQCVLPIVETILPPIYSDEPFEDRKSVFQAHLSPVHSKEEVQLVLHKLKENKKIANATHNIYAYRIWDEKRNVILTDCDDDGETGASSRMLHLMDTVDVKNVLVVVSRWFGGILLHNDRFKHINNACRMILINHDYIKKVPDTIKNKSKKSS
ncbi:unnamed protein product [Rotaria sordida]|uniref:RWD domain-containing protein n=1 Tax=Rotaria sordida TaxID=392033 RepID=A0A814Y8G4_9BILA|nr:unnamed protein product [Rotaria sordida]CAF1508284.1 unnamed protein product [Rotaria sordida]